MTDIKINTIPNSRIMDLTGDKYGRLTVLGFSHIASTNDAKYWVCKCDCGTIKTIASKHLRSGGTQSCKCLQKETGHKTAIHGEASVNHRTPEYAAYCRAKNRCESLSNAAYDRYGGRGIKVRFESYEHFLSEIGRRPSSKHSLDRINNNGHYEPGNVRWATSSEQNRNKRTNVQITALGKTMCATAWANQLGGHPGLIQDRRSNGWCTECAVSIRPKSGTCTHK